MVGGALTGVKAKQEAWPGQRWMKRSNAGIGSKPGTHVGSVVVVSGISTSMRKCLICAVSLQWERSFRTNRLCPQGLAEGQAAGS